MATNDFLSFAIGAGANVLTQSDYAALTARSGGFTAGTAKSIELNKVWRQASVMSATLAQFIADKSGNDVLDNGNLATIQTNLGLAINAAIASGLQYATQAEAEAGVVTNKVMNPLRVAQAITALVPYATQAEAEAGTITNKVMSPLRVSQSIAANVPYATQAEAEAGTITNKVMSPLRVAQAVAAKIVQATESVLGILRISTQTQVDAGTDNATAVTPLKLKNGYLSSFVANGYIKFPSWLGGFTVQWMTIATTTTDTVFTFPTAFTTLLGTWVGFLGTPASATGTVEVVYIKGFSSTGVTCQQSSATSRTSKVFAVGVI